MFESKFVSKEEVDHLLDKISNSGITSLNDIEKNRLKIFSEDDKEIINIIDNMADITAKFKKLNHEMKKISDEGKDTFILMNKWDELNKKLVPLEQSFRKYGIYLGDERLTLLMRRQRPDVYDTSVYESKVEQSNLKFNKQPKKKGAKTDVYNVSKGSNTIGQIKWSSRMRGYAFLPTPDCDIKIKDFIKDLMKKRREEKSKNK